MCRRGIGRLWDRFVTCCIDCIGVLSQGGGRTLSCRIGFLRAGVAALKEAVVAGQSFHVQRDDGAVLSRAWRLRLGGQNGTGTKQREAARNKGADVL